MSELCRHDWVGDDECAYCKCEELEERIAELEKQIETGKSAYSDLLGNSMNEIRELGEQLKAIKETQSAEVHDLKEQVRIRGERMERMFRNLPLKLQDYLKAMGEFDDNGKVL